MRSELFGSDFLSRLERLCLAIRNRGAGGPRGTRRGRRTGASIEFADHRDYVPGDEIRAVDWNIYGRLDRLMVKLYEEERGADLHLLVDASGSMRLGLQNGETGKFDQARLIAAALAYIGLAGQDRVGLHFFASHLGAGSGPLKGRVEFKRTLDFLDAAPELPGITDFEAVCSEFVNRTRRRGLVVVLGDFWEGDRFESGLRWLVSAGFEVSALQILDDAEIEPPLRGELTLLDAETGTGERVACSGTALAEYKAALDAHLERIAGVCRQRRCGYARLSASDRFDAIVLGPLRDRGILK
jgi:uncharacterized protein (DUF58 family)